MGLLDVLGGVPGLGATRPQASRSSMSPLAIGLLGLLAYKTFKGQGKLGEMLNKEGTGGLGGLLTGGALSSGLSDLLERLKQNGHNDKVESWVASGQSNPPISATELEQALGEERIQWLMKQTGMARGDLLAGLSRALPETVDKLTPEGRIPTAQEVERL